MDDNRDLVAELALGEKIQCLHGALDPAGKATGYLPGIERLDIPPLCLVDGPMGVRAVGERATAFPASICLAASWDPDLARTFGRALGREAAALGQDMVLGPGVNIIRVPHGGRNFEYYSEDPHLTSRIAVGTIEGIQSTGVGATVKHFVANNQETNRYEVSADVSERGLREIYLPAFRAAVEQADVRGVMAAYNRVNGTRMTEHDRLLQDVLRQEWGFEGVVVSDWWATRRTIEPALSGLDIEMPGVDPGAFGLDDADGGTEPVNPDLLPPPSEVPARFGEPLETAVRRGRVPEEVIDRKLDRLFDVMAAIDGGVAGELDSRRHRELAERIAREGSVLLCNDAALPLDDAATIALIGANADSPKLGGGGSSEVPPFSATSPLEALEARGGDVRFARGIPRLAESRLFETGDPTERGDSPRIEAAIRSAESADCAVVVVQDDATEFRDRDSLSLPGEQNALIDAIAEAAERIVVVLRTSGPVTMPWLELVDAVLAMWYPGQADGEALAALLYGDKGPGGRLPVTFGRSAAAYPTAEPGAFPGDDDVVRYLEDVNVGYRHFASQDLDPLFPFGHGETYGNVRYEDVAIREASTGVELAVTVRNVGDRPCKEVVQAYVHKAPATVRVPKRELAGFAPISIQPGESRTAIVRLNRETFSYYDDGWRVASGDYPVYVGRSARDDRLSADVTL